ncbi:hypothetical protein HYV49_00860 [Candidatus Pacearchaeota archaeon]|nr:hypothetical protein [Candidatus Pacearchaeota archaeon]
MKKMLFLFGRDKSLSYLELISYFKRRGISFKFIKKDEDYLIVETELDVSKAVNELGGVVKIGKFIAEDDIPKLVGNMPGKLYYALQDFDNSNIADKFKHEFKTQKLKAQDITHKISPTEIINKKLIETQSDFIYANGMLFQTIAVSDVKAIEKRDIGRPVQDVTEAISIRLAKILINLSQVTDNGELLDPFCGIGTILQEALLMGINVTGIDSSPEKVDGARKNLEWFNKEYNIKNKFRLSVGDARALSRILKYKVDAIATEPYLGPLLKEKLSIKEAEKRINELTQLYKRFFEEDYNILSSGGFIAIILPYFSVKNQKIRININEVKGKFKSYNIDNLIPVEYTTGKSKIGREIYILVK